VGKVRTNIPKATWDAVKVAYLSGMSCKDIAENFGILENTVQIKVCKEGWNKIIKESVKSVTPAPEALEKVADMLENDWKNKGAAHRAHIYKIAHEALKKSSLPAPRTWKDAQIADNMARKAVGLDEEKGSTSVINVGFMHQTAGAVVTRIDNDVVDAEFEAESDRETGDD
jgi:hypothetical protein